MNRVFVIQEWLLDEDYTSEMLQSIHATRGLAEAEAARLREASPSPRWSYEVEAWKVEHA